MRSTGVSADQPSDFPRYVIVVAFGEDAFRGRQPHERLRIIGIGTHGGPQRLDIAAAPRPAHRCECCRRRR